MSIGQWIGTFLLTAIPLVGFILIILWAVGDGTNPNKKNWARASLILMAIFLVLGILFFVLFGIMAASLMPHQSRF